jgi:hypothetical protein
MMNKHQQLKIRRMKIALLSICTALVLTSSLNAQTAVNFNCNDCAGNNHDLFTELDAGKVIVISWVMPCGTCIGPTITASNIVQSYAGSNPGQVFLYVVDDYANTNCTSLGSWCTNNGITATTFSNAAIDMLDYNSTPGMPKIVVLGGTSHSVYFNAVNAAAGDPVAIQSAIDSALVTGVNETQQAFEQVNLFPNPAGDLSLLSFTVSKPAESTIDIYDQLGQRVSNVYSGTLLPGEHSIPLNIGDLAAGIYFVQINDAENCSMVRLVVVH